LRILGSIHLATLMAKQMLGPIVAAKMVNLTLLRGCTEESIYSFIFYGIQLCGQGNIEQGYQFGQLARAACAKERSKGQFAEVCANGYYYVFHWKEPIRALIQDMQRGYQGGLDTGYMAAATNCLSNATSMAPVIAGFELTGLEKQIRRMVGVAEQLKQGPYVVWLRIYWQFVLNFMRSHDNPCILKGEAYDEDNSLPAHYENKDDLTIQLVFIMKLMLCYRFNKHRDVVAFYAQHVENRYPPSGVLFPPTTMYYCLAQLALYPEERPARQKAILEDVGTKRQQLRAWAAHGPMNYAHKFHLVEAEVARVLGDDREAREHYDLAIDLARENEYLNEESLALERAALFFLEMGRPRLAGYYLRDAYYAYQRWGAEAKLSELRQNYPDLLASLSQPARRETRAFLARGHRDTLTTGELPDLDLATLLKASRVISAEHDQSRLLEHVLSICLQHVGARRGFLILARHDELIVKAKGVFEQHAEIELVSESLGDQDGLSQGIVHYVAKTLEAVLLDNAAQEGSFKNDPYIRANACSSVLCIPIVHQGTLVGITYMENNRAPGAFQVERMDILRLLMAQAAVSIENASLRSTSEEIAFRFAVGGSLAADTPSYVLRAADRELTQRIERGEFCYVFNARQMGKSSLRIHTMAHLSKKGYRCAAVDLTSVGSETVSAEQWYAGVARAIVSGLALGGDVNLRSFWRDRAFLSPVQRLSELMDEIVLERIAEPIAIFIDEIDMVLSLGFGLDDFFALIRSFYNNRADDCRYQRLTFVLLGVATPTDLIQDKTRTAFNIGHAIPMGGFRYAEARLLTLGLAGIGDPEHVLKSILTWTDGQPFLSQKLCQLARLAESRPPVGKEREWVANLVRDRVVDKWRTRDEPEHLKTIEARILRSRNRTQMLDRYREILEHGAVAVSETALEFELVLSGLVVCEWGKLRVGNLIYASVFNSDWVNAAMAHSAE
jgi:GAF domain-containing protein